MSFNKDISNKVKTSFEGNNFAAPKNLWTNLKEELDHKGKKPLSEEELNSFGKEIGELRKEVEADLGQDDVAYIKRMIRLSRMSEIVGRLLIHVA